MKKQILKASSEPTKVGVLLVNLGTPDRLTVTSVRRYLREFLSDSRVINLPRWLWLPILNLIVLVVRPRKSLEAYRKVWLEKQDQSPLLYYTQQLTQKLADKRADIELAFAMRYGQPAIAQQIEHLQQKGCNRLLIVPLYPQYSATTNATVVDHVAKHLKSLVWQPTIRIADPWFAQPNYINALKRQVEQAIAEGYQPDKILLSFHGLPNASIDQGDPYYYQCLETGRLLTQALGKNSNEVLVTFQSRFGPAQWLQPYTSETLEALPEQGVKKLLVLTPGFVADCIETLEEIAIEGAEEFIAAGGEHCRVLPCLNDSELGIEVMDAVINEGIAGWHKA
ncbi:ferrochelatase [Reinekea thalattae]|uniref:Ferrochelatase n=1 Tax=Reinekea thalattae TaxID=2593301 RepID=A0A5C8ZCD9_9GAMM|nr:ferrochelatase [Reinekea thalattae]TXR54841.1 ferrochelatase [Reinekea thalattae]